MSGSISRTHARYGTNSTNPFQAAGGAVINSSAYRSSKGSLGNSPTGLPFNSEASRGQIPSVQWRFGQEQQAAKQQKRLFSYLQENKKSRKQLLDQLALSKKEEFEKTVDKEVQKGLDNTEDFQDTSEIYHSDDDSLMQDIAGEYTPFGGKLVGQLGSGPNLLL